jgi:hypothetical protein
MRRMNRLARLMGVTASVTFLAVAMMGSTGASASIPASVATHVSAPKTHKAATPDAPSGCNNGYFCEYNAGNGGNLCFQTKKGGNWPGGCVRENEGEYNRNGNGYYMYGYTQYGRCDYLLYSGHYLLYNSKDHFESGAKDCTSLKLEHNVLSGAFT